MERRSQLIVLMFVDHERPGRSLVEDHQLALDQLERWIMNHNDERDYAEETASLAAAHAEGDAELAAERADVTLSPSGTVYAVYDTYRDSHQASGVANMLQGNHPEWHVRAALIGPGDRCVVQWAHRKA